LVATIKPKRSIDRPSRLKSHLGILRPVIKPAAGFLFVDIADYLHRRTIGTEVIGDEDVCATMAFHGLPEEFQGCLAITALCDKAFQDFPFVIHSPPTVVHLATPIAHPARLNRFCSDSAQLSLPCSPLIFPCYG
jgi:hypothetical protein